MPHPLSTFPPLTSLLAMVESPIIKIWSFRSFLKAENNDAHKNNNANNLIFLIIQLAILSFVTNNAYHIFH